ncbi:MAG: hypothetical protein L6R36_003741 [Xanthoria steineri]|nr:MAG: hypothetical protein L6R36_003741 [Xanthoria steineri]
MRRLPRRLVVCLVFTALLVFGVRRALPTQGLWGRATGQESPAEPATFPQLGDPARYSHQVENVPAPKIATMGNTNRKDKTLEVGGGRMDLAAGTDNLLAQWISKEREASDSQDRSTPVNHQAEDGSEGAAVNPGASQETPAELDGTSGKIQS